MLKKPPSCTLSKHKSYIQRLRKCWSLLSLAGLTARFGWFPERRPTGSSRVAWGGQRGVRQMGKQGRPRRRVTEAGPAGPPAPKATLGGRAFGPPPWRVVPPRGGGRMRPGFGPPPPPLAHGRPCTSAAGEEQLGQVVSRAQPGCRHFPIRGGSLTLAWYGPRHPFKSCLLQAQITCSVLGSHPVSAPYKLCDPGQVAYPLRASIFSCAK